MVKKKCCRGFFVSRFRWIRSFALECTPAAVLLHLEVFEMYPQVRTAELSVLIGHSAHRFILTQICFDTRFRFVTNRRDVSPGKNPMYRWRLTKPAGDVAPQKIRHYRARSRTHPLIERVKYIPTGTSDASFGRIKKFDCHS